MKLFRGVMKMGKRSGATNFPLVFKMIWYSENISLNGKTQSGLE